jgi:serine/threonine-protein kinase
MKPANVLFDASTGQAKVVDFGIAKGLEDTGGGLTRTSGLIGTAAYLSPEQVSGREATHASDLYAVGCLLYCCLAGDPPFGGPTAIAIAMRHLRDPVPPLRPRRPDLPADFDAVVTHALEKDPARRFSSAQQMDTAVAATGLDRHPASEPQVSAAVPAGTAAMHEHPVGAALGTETLHHPARPRSNTGWLAALTAFLVVAAAAAVAVLYLQSRQPPLVEATPLPAATPLPTFDEPTPEASPSPTATPDDGDEDEDDEETEPPGGLIGNLPGFGN